MAVTTRPITYELGRATVKLVGAIQLANQD